MSKKLIYAAVAAALAVGCQTATTQTETAVATSVEQTTPTTQNGQYNGIVYLNSDSLIQGYHLFIDLKASFDAKAAKAQTELDSRGRSLERKVTEFQYNIQKGLITRATAAETEQKLTQEQQELLQYRETTLATLQEEEQVMFNKISNNIDLYLKKYNDTKKYTYILSTNNLSKTVLAADPALDITADVLKGINNEYKASSKK